MKKQIKNTELADLLHKLDPPYGSKPELQIGRILDQYGIPFFYQQAMVIYYDGKNEIWKPTFTLPQQGGYVIDYIAQSNDQNHQKNLTQKRKKIYDYNQIPATVLGPKDLDKPNFRNDLYQKLKEEFYRFHNPLAYGIPSPGQ
jgi:hypothetical protein